MRDFKQIVKGLRFKPNDGGSNPIGDLSGVLTAADNGAVYHYQNRLKAFLDAVEREIITNDQAQTITNKTIDADNNTISNIENDNIKAGAAIAESKLALDYSTSSLNTAISDHIADATDAHDSSAISYNNATSGLTSTDAQGAIDEVEGRLQTAEQDISNHIADTVDAHDASAISNVPAGNLAATDVQGALNELQSDIDTRALASDLSNHLSDPTDAHDASAISYVNITSGLTATDIQGAIDEVEGRLDTVETDAGTAQTDIDNHIADTTDAHDASAISNVPSGNLAATDVQGALNELQSDVDTRALNSDLTTHTSASTNVHGLSGGAAVVGTTSTQTLTNKTIQGASIESPTRLDVKKDTKANLETYATTAANGQLCFATDEKIMYQVVDNALTEVGSGSGVGSVDIMFADQFDSTAIADYTTTGTVALTEDVLEVLQGKKSLEILHTGGASAERTIPVDIKFRGKNVTLSLDVASDALSGNLTLTVTDETNTVTLINAESIQPQEAGQTSVKRSVSFNVPSDCEELKYKFTAVSESGKISFIDNVVIELTQTAKLDTTIETPIITEWQDYSLVIGATVTAPTQGASSVNKAQWRRVGANMEIRYDYKQTGAGTTGSGNYLFPMPAGYSVDTAKIPSGSAEQNIVGIAKMSNGTSAVGGATVPGVVLLSKTYPNNFLLNYAQTSTENTTYVSSAAYPLNSATIGFSFTASVPILGWEATETQSVSLAQTVLVQESDSFINASGTTGYGSTRTRIRRFTNVRSLGNAITYIDDPVNGASFVVNEAGLYDLSFTEQSSSGTPTHNITVNQTNFPTATAAEIVASATISTATGTTTASVGGYYLNVGDVVRCNSALTVTSNLLTEFNISKAGSLKQLNVSENQKIEIPTSELRMEGASSRGTGSDAAVVRFNNTALLRGDAFEIESTAAIGTIVTMKKKGKVNVSSSVRIAAAATLDISKNQSTRTGLSIIPSEIMARVANNSNFTTTVSSEFFVNIGDKIRIISDNGVTANDGNSLNITFQEQEVSVSVTNVLPQFSESDSSVRVDTANGYGSTATRIRRFSNVRDNLGSAITYADSATNGSSFTVNESGVYHISYSDNFTSNSTAYIGISKNSSQLTSAITDINTVDRLASSFIDTATASREVSWQGYLQKDDVIRAHVGLAHAANNNALTSFTISKVGKPNVTGVDVTPFTKIEYEVKDEVQANTHAGYGATNTRIPYYTNITKNTNRGLIRVENSATLGFSITVLKACELTISSSHVASSNVAHGLTLNSNQLSTDIFSITPPTRLTLSYTSFADTNQAVTASYTGFFQAGDVIRPHTTGTTPAQVNRANISVVATELRDAYQVIGGGVENTYSARIANNGTATLVSQSYPFIDSISRTTTGTIQINFKAGFFTVAPSLTATVVFPGASDRYALVDSVSTTTAIVKTFQTSTGTSLFDVDFFINLQRQGSDYRTPSKAIGLPAQRVAVIKDVKAATTAMQTLTASVWTTRVLNNLVDPTGIVTSLASNQFVLPAGKYFISARCPVMSGVSGISFHKAALYNVTDAANILIGTTERTLSPSGSSHTGNSVVEGHFTLTAAKTLDIRHIVGTTYSAEAAPNFSSTDEIYTTVVITKIEE